MVGISSTYIATLHCLVQNYQGLSDFRERNIIHKKFCGYAMSAMYFCQNLYHETKEARPFHENFDP